MKSKVLYDTGEDGERTIDKETGLALINLEPTLTCPSSSSLERRRPALRL